MAAGPAVNSIKYIKLCIKTVLRENQINHSNDVYLGPQAFTWGQ